MNDPSQEFPATSDDAISRAIPATGDSLFPNGGDSRAETYSLRQGFDVSAGRAGGWVLEMRMSVVAEPSRPIAAPIRDPRKWEQPDVFDLTRRTAGLHLVFGGGAHICIGNMIARLEADVMLTALAKRVERFELAGEPSYRIINTLRTLRELPLRIVKAARPARIMGETK